jgi:hypothetical protein
MAPTPPPSQPQRRAAAIAVGFGLAWLLILLAGADHPPPPGFLWLLPWLALAGVIVWRRVPAYAAWRTEAWPWRVPRVLAEGLLVGLALGLAALALHAPAGPERLTDRLIWLAVLAALGAVNGVVVYLLSAPHSFTPSSGRP